jgi:hypothetical protein
MHLASPACLVPCYVKGARASGLLLTRLSGTRSQIGESSGGNIKHQVTRGVLYEHAKSTPRVRRV